MAQTYDTFWQQQFAKAIAEKIRHESEVVCAGGLDHASYKELTGRIRGLSMALETIEEVSTEIHKAEAGRK